MVVWTAAFGNVRVVRTHVLSANIGYSHVKKGYFLLVAAVVTPSTACLLSILLTYTPWAQPVLLEVTAADEGGCVCPLQDGHGQGHGVQGGEHEVRCDNACW